MAVNDAKRARKNQLKREYRQRNKEKIREYKRVYRQKNKEKINEYAREYYRRNKENYIKYYQENREKRILQMREYGQQNKCEITDWKRNYIQNNIQPRLAANLRTGIYRVLKGINKSLPTMELLGCSIEEFKQHLESKFTEGMAWDNYGEWHVDHVKPCASFDLTDPEQQRECFNWKNLQPLWAEDNWTKGYKII